MIPEDNIKVVFVVRHLGVENWVTANLRSSSGLVGGCAINMRVDQCSLNIIESIIPPGRNFQSVSANVNGSSLYKAIAIPDGSANVYCQVSSCAIEVWNME